MCKKILMAGLAVGVVLTALQGTAQAGWNFLQPPGMWWYFGSIEGCGVIEKVRSTSQHPARLSCDIEVTKVESLCYNPANKNVSPGEAATKVVFSATDPIGEEDLLGGKNKGNAEACVKVASGDADCTTDPDNPLCRDEYCVNPNWHIQYVTTTAFLADCSTDRCSSREVDETGEVCIGGEWQQQDTQLCECVLPAGDLPPAPGTPFECLEVVRDSWGLLSYTGETCELQ